MDLIWVYFRCVIGTKCAVYFEKCTVLMFFWCNHF